MDKFEIIVGDGISDDGAREIVMEFGKRYVNVELVDNPNRITLSAVNLGILQNTGKVIAIAGAHAVCHCHYLSECVRNLEPYGADEVGAVAP